MVLFLFAAGIVNLFSFKGDWYEAIPAYAEFALPDPAANEIFLLLLGCLPN